MERGGCEIEGPFQPVKSTAREEGQDVDGNTQPSLHYSGFDTLHYLILSTHAFVKFAFIESGLAISGPPLDTFAQLFFSFVDMSQTAKDLIAGTTGGIGQVIHPL
jgi:hypothetical protein